ncbi:hypothetical protein P1J78_15970 [Psychromarinibacter sp. C21-152]|uniref:Uncharacterized protein n=1 Tax=Psychromarinibacter sediminicola TaxID=3033385 RepID=A0AAE3NX38_9RHOB|nr:hypothetical protein [Psychromarinibacter sediminicola]
MKSGVQVIVFSWQPVAPVGWRRMRIWNEKKPGAARRSIGLKHVAQKWEPVLCSSDMRHQEIGALRVNAHERDAL